MSFGVSKLLMIGAPLPFFLYNLKCLKDTYYNRRVLYRSIIYNVVPTQIFTMGVLIVAVSCEWIVQERFWISFGMQFVFFLTYMYLTGLLYHFARLKKREELAEGLLDGSMRDSIGGGDDSVRADDEHKTALAARQAA